MFYIGLFSIISVIFAVLIFSKKLNPVVRDTSLVGTLISTCALGRISMAEIPSVQPVTFLVLIAGYTYGSAIGFIVGAASAVVSNMVLIQGPWTVWQAIAWGLVGASGGLLKALMKNPKKAILVSVAFVWGYLFGAITDVFYWLFFIPYHTVSTFTAVIVSGLAFDTAHAVGNSLFMFALGIPLINILEKLRSAIYGLQYERIK